MEESTNKRKLTKKSKSKALLSKAKAKQKCVTKARQQRWVMMYDKVEAWSLQVKVSELGEEM